MMKTKTSNTVSKSIKVAAISLATLGVFAIPARAQVVSHEVTETKTVTGTVSDLTPTSSIVVTSPAGAPTTYTIDKKTVFVDQNGNTISYDQVRGQPVKVYVSESKAEEPVVVERVVVTKPVTRVIEQPAPQVLQRTETRTETKSED
jgi:hypothetical protein